MKIFKNKLKLQKYISKDKHISFVPTMGGLHEGHLSLIKKAKSYNKKVLVSIFVNPKQFNIKNDFHNYPRNLTNDVRLLKKVKIDYLYLPTYKDLYGFKPTNSIYLGEFSKQLCGKNRKGHFKGVLNVVNRFLEIIKPKYLFLGLKDFQQLTLINLHILKNKINTKVVKCKTIREKNGVACSTRNYALNIEQLNIASKVYKYLLNIKKKINRNFYLCNSNLLRKNLISLGVDKIDYIEYIDLRSFKKVKKTRNKFKIISKIFIAYYIKKIRLIDNI